ncbi:MAG: PilN domain-containing protein [bacterium]
MAKKIYIQLNKKKLLISKIKRYGNKFFLKNPRTFNIQASQDNKIFNLSSIYTQIKNYLKKNKHKKTKAIICSPQASNEKNLLQLTLVCSKANLLIEKITGKSQLKRENCMTFFNKNDLDNQLDFFKKIKPPKKSFPFFWITGTTCLILITLFTLNQLQQLETRKLEYLNDKFKKMNTQNENLKILLQQNHSLQANNKKLNDQKKLLQKAQNNPQNILLSISQTIPDICWLENLKFDYLSKDKTGKNKQHLILIQGKAVENKDILNLTKKLSLNPLFNNIKIESIKKEKFETNRFHLEKPKVYSFKISGIII